MPGAFSHSRWRVFAYYLTCLWAQAFGPLGQLVDDDDREGEDRQRPERVGRDREQRADRVEGAMKMPNQRPNSPPEKSEKAATSSSTPMIRMIQPQVLRPLRM